MAAKRQALAPPPTAGEARDRLLARVAFEAIWERDFRSDALTWDEQVESIFGYDRAEVVNHISWWRARVHRDDLERVEQMVAEAVRGSDSGWSNEYRFRRKDGSWAWVWSRCAIERDGEGRARRAVGAMMDISRFRETEARLQRFTGQIRARATATDRDLRVIWDAGAGYPDRPSTVGATVPELFSDSPDRERVLDACHKALAGESSRLLIDDGKQAAQLELGPMRDLSGDVTGVMGVAFDITERVRAEEDLRKLQRVLVEAQKLGQTGSWEHDLLSGLIINTDGNLRLFFGDDRGKGAQFEDYAAAIHPDDRERVMKWREALLARPGDREIEYRVVWPDGSIHVVHALATVVRDDSGRPVRAYGTNADVTGRKRSEEEVARRARERKTARPTRSRSAASTSRGCTTRAPFSMTRSSGGRTAAISPPSSAPSRCARTANESARSSASWTSLPGRKPRRRCDGWPPSWRRRGMRSSASTRRQRSRAGMRAPSGFTVMRRKK
jgi:hypothetical protein